MLTLFLILITLVSYFDCMKLEKLENFKNEAEVLKSKFINFDSIRSYADKKKYHLYTHDSGLEVLIVQDVNVKVASAGLAVNAGVDGEEKDIYGLAHFTEHMLFLGSKKYSNVTYFVDYITLYNGKFNGFTDFETTAFFFKINSERFTHALDIFSRFFIDPLFSAEYVEKEVNSVNSEFERNIQLDSKRMEMVLRDVADEDSLFHRFSTGNTNTLLKFTRDKGIDLRARVLEFYNKYYRPDNMRLVIYGDQSISEYKNMVETAFKEMKRRPDPYVPKVHKKLPWEFHKIGKVVLFQTINNHQTLDISMMLEDIFAALPNNPALYFKVLLNYRGRGSLDDVLRRKGLVAGIKSFLRRTHRGFSLFKLRGYITKRGIKNIDKVIGIIYKYLKYVREKAMDEKLYNYVKRVFDIAFYYMNRKKPVMRYIKAMCHLIWKYPKKYIFSQHKVLNEYNKEVLTNFGNKLVLKNSIILIGNKSFDGLTGRYNTFMSDYTPVAVLAKNDPFYFTKYSQFNLSPNFVNQVDSALSASELKGKKMKLFSHRKSLPKIISLVKTCPANARKECVVEMRNDGIELTPQRIAKTNLYELWYKKDRSFLVAKTNLFLKFEFDFDVNNSSNATKIRLLIFALNHHLRHFFFDESLRQNSFEVSASANGFTSRIYSFTETLESTAFSFFKRVRSMKLKKEEFELIKDEMINNIKGQLNLVPALRAYVNFFTLVLKDYVQRQVILTELEKLTLADFESFFENLFKKFYVKAFAHGTADTANIEKVFQKLFTVFDKKTIAPISKQMQNYKNLHSDLSGYFIFREQLTQKYNINHAVLNFYQIGRENIANVVNANLVKALCGYIYFTQLRIKEQLGYTARAKVFAEGNVIYYMIVVQGSRKTPDHMDLRIENVVKMMRARIVNTIDRKFTKFKYLIARKVGRRDRSIKHRTQRLWNEIITGRKYYNLRDIARNYVKDLTKEQLLEFFDKMVSKQMQKLSVQEFSNLVKSVPTTTPKVRGYQSVLINEVDYLRKRNKFIK